MTSHEKKPDDDYEDRDDYAMQEIVSKYEERKIAAQPAFEQICSKYWQLVATGNDGDCSKNTLSQAQYTGLMLRIYRVLSPLYRADEVEKEVQQEWAMDAAGQTQMSLTLFQKTLFRVAHQWATSIDEAEYVDLLQKVLERITHRRIVRSSGQVENAMPSICVQLQQKIFDPDADDEEEDQLGWASCDSGEQRGEDEDFTYREKDGKNFKKRRPKAENEEIEEGSESEGEFMFSSRDPFQFTEKVLYYAGEFDWKQERAPAKPEPCDFEYSVLTDLENVFPLGYPTEQYLSWVKNDVYKAFQRLKEEKKQALATMKRDLFEGGTKGSVSAAPVQDSDPGMVAEGRQTLTFNFLMHSSKFDVKVLTYARMLDKHYNGLRTMLKEANQITIRPENDFPRRDKNKELPVFGDDGAAEVDLKEPLVRKSIFGHNPALERRLKYRVTQVEDKKGSKQAQWVNVNYLLVDPVFETAYRSDVLRVETSHKMAIQPADEFKRDDEFCNVTTSFAEAKQIMLQKKFESLFTVKLQGDEESAVERDNKVFGLERHRKKFAAISGSLSSKVTEENFFDNNFLRCTSGPFYKLLSRAGPSDDNFYTMATQDLIDTATNSNLQILILGMPRIGKSVLAQQLAQRLNVVHVTPESWISQLLAKVKDREENPPDEVEPELEEGQEPPPKKNWLSPLEEEVLQTLRAGGAPSSDLIDQMLCELIASPAVATRGFVLDLTFTAINEIDEELTWVKRLQKAKLLETENFTHVVDLLMDDVELRRRAEQMLSTVKDGQVFSRWERTERNKPRIKAGEDEDDEPEDDDEGEGRPKPLVEAEMVQRLSEAQQMVAKQMTSYKNKDRPDFDSLIIKLAESQFIQVQVDGLTPEELALTVTSRIRTKDSNPLTPVATAIEGGGDLKGLLTEGIEPEDGTLPRQWSLWKGVDPVSLKRGQVSMGQAEFACHYAHNVFVFENEENQHEFVVNPREYLQMPPQMPPSYRLMVLGPRSAGVNTQAQKLEELYGWRVVNFVEIVRNKLAQIMAMPEKPPNNVTDEGPCAVCCSVQELQDIKDGKFIPSWKFLPWVLEYLEVPLMQRPAPPPEEVQEPDLEAMTDDERKAYEKDQKKKADEKRKREKDEEEKARAKEERAKQRAAACEEGKDLAELGLEETEEEIIIDDLSLEQLVPQVDANGQIPQIGAFIMIGFPQTELQIAKLKEYGLNFDRIVYLNDMSEEDPGSALKSRFKKKYGRETTWDWERESEAAQKVVTTLKEHLNEESVREINCLGTSEEVFIRIRTELDPFFLLPDNPDDNRTTEAEVEVDDEDYSSTKWLPKSNFGHYCPVTYVAHNWLFKGNREFESTLHGKTYWFAGEAEQADFKFNPSAFLSDLKLPLQAPPPKVMLVGMKGSGVTTQIEKLCDKFKIDSLKLLPAYLEALQTEKNKRERTRLLARGFRPLPEAEEGEEEPVDPEIVEDPEDFDRAVHEREVLQNVLKSELAMVLDGHWTSAPEEAVSQPLQELLLEARRTPEIVIILRCKEESTFERCLDKKAIYSQFEQLNQQRKDNADKQREEDRLTKRAELEEEHKQDPEDENRKSDEEVTELVEEALDEWLRDRLEADEQAEEDDPDRPVLEDMLEAEKEKLKEMRDRDETFLQELYDALREKQVEVIDSISTEISAEYVHIKILSLLKQRTQFRKDLIEREQCQPLPEAEVPHYESSYLYKHSKFGVSSPLRPFSPCKTKKHAVLYRERLYFPGNAEERAQFMLEPSKYTLGVEPTPLDLTLQPTAIVVGLAKSGRSSFARQISTRTGMVHLDMAQVVELFVDRDCVSSEFIAHKARKLGEQLDDATLVDLLARRINMKDCIQSGWILDGFPQTREQAVLMLQQGINPLNVFHLQMPAEEAFKRSAADSTNKFCCVRSVLARRLAYQSEHTPAVAYLYQKFFNSVTSIDAKKSHWFIQTLALEAIECCMRARLQFSRDYYFRKSEGAQERPCVMQSMNTDRVLLKQSLSQFGYMCPVTWRKNKQFVKCTHLPENCVLYGERFFYFAGEEERNIFLLNPGMFTERIMFSQDRNVPVRMRQHKAAEIVAQEKAINGHCSVTLKDGDCIARGNQLILVSFKDARYVFASHEQAAKFFMNPGFYASASLPVKMPPNSDPVSLYQLQKRDDSITFMEQALGQVVTRGLREVGENRLKYPTLSVKETMLKLFAIFLKAENPANTDYMREKYRRKMKDFIYRCEVPVELSELAADRAKKRNVWPAFKEEYYNKLGDKHDQIMREVVKERLNGFSVYIK